MRRVLFLTCCLLVLGGVASADTVVLPTPDAARLASIEILKQLPNFKPDRVLASDVPGPVINDEVVRVGVSGDGTVVTTMVDQRLRLTGEGDYSVRERGPARSASSLSAEPPPVTRRGAVVWQGFSPGSRDLAARLTLDPLLEAQHLPLTVAVAFTGADGSATALNGGRVPSAGTVTVTVTNVTSQPQVLPTAADASPALLAPLLDKALAVARRPGPGRLPSTDDGLPAKLTVTGAAEMSASQAMPLRLTGSLRLIGTTGTVEGPATTATADGATFAGTLGGSAPQNAGASVVFTMHVAGSGRLALDLRAVGALNQGELVPPNGFSSWARWAAAGPPLAERKAAVDLLVAVAATGARASSYSPYLGADLKGTGSTTFQYGFAPAVKQVALRAALQPRWGALSLTGLALLLLLTNATLIWRRS